MESVERVLHTTMPFTTGGQTISDRLTAAKHSLAGSQLGKSVCKATTEEPIGPKKKHLDYLLHCTHEPNVSIPQLANLLIERTANGNWAVVFKALVTIHNMMCYGNERFTQYLASCNANLDLANFTDKASVNGYEMSIHVRRYAKYIGEKIYTYRLCAFDFCKIKRGREDGLLRTMHADKLLKTLPILQGQVDALLEFNVAPAELTNGIINSCFIMMFRDLIRLFACYNDGIINLLEKYFDMKKGECRQALDLYKAFLTRMDSVKEFLKVAESVGIDKGEIPDLAKAPNSLLEALEAHLAGLEGSRGPSRVTSPTGPSPAMSTAIQELSFGEHVDEVAKAKYLREEQERLNALREQRLGREAASNPFAAAGSSLEPPTSKATGKASPIDDLLGLFDTPNGTTQPPPPPMANNPFAAPAVSNPYLGGGYGAPQQQPYYGTAAQQPSNTAFAPNFNAAFSQPTQQPPASYGGGFDSATVPRPPSATSGSSDYAGGTNPFLSDFGGGAATELVNPFPISAGLPEPPDSSGDEEVGGELANPFNAFRQNMEALNSATGGRGGGGHAEVVLPAQLQPPTPSPTPGSSPLPVPHLQPSHTLGIYDETPFCGGDSSYTATPVFQHAGIPDPQPGMMMGGGGFDPLGDMLVPMGGATGAPPAAARGPQPKTKVITKDLDSSLASLADNLSLNKGQANKPVQWGGASQPRMAGPPPQQQKWAPPQQAYNPFPPGNPFPQQQGNPFPPQQQQAWGMPPGHGMMQQPRPQHNPQDPFGAL